MFRCKVSRQTFLLPQKRAKESIGASHNYKYDPTAAVVRNWREKLLTRQFSTISTELFFISHLVTTPDPSLLLAAARGKPNPTPSTEREREREG